MIAPLDNVRVLDLTNWMAGPSAAAILADLGADVVKVEPLGGDVVRGHARQPKAGPGIPAVDASFEADNRGKRSIAVALDKPGGADLVRIPHRARRHTLAARGQRGRVLSLFGSRRSTGCACTTQR